MSEEDTITIEIPAEIVELAESTKPEGKELEDWILEWTKFGLEISGMASARKEALDIGANIEKAAVRKFAELVNEETVAFRVRLQALEDLTNVDDQKAGFGKLFKDLKDYVDPDNKNSIISEYADLLGKVDDEKGLFRMAIKAELTKEGGLKEKLDKILIEMNIESGKQQIRRKSAVKGGKFEDTLVGVLGELVGSNDISFRKTSNTIGVLPKGTGHNKKGDIRIDFGIGHVLHGNPIIIEAKDDASIFPENPKNHDKSALHYLDKAMENRECSVGIWIHNKSTAGHFDRDFWVQGNMIFVVWDEEDPSTDWLLLAAIYIAIGRVKISSDDVEETERIAISNVISKLKDEADRFSQMRKFIDIVKTNVKHLDNEITAGTTNISECVKDAKKALKKLEGDSDDSDLEFEDSDSTAASEEE
jgi:hypothetical protein